MLWETVAYRDYRIWPAIMVDADELRSAIAEVGDFGWGEKVANSIASWKNIFFLHAIAQRRLDSLPRSTR